MYGWHKHSLSGNFEVVGHKLLILWEKCRKLAGKKASRHYEETNMAKIDGTMGPFVMNYHFRTGPVYAELLAYKQAVWSKEYSAGFSGSVY